MGLLVQTRYKNLHIGTPPKRYKRTMETTGGASSSSGAGDDDGSDPCPICLEKVKKDEAFLDQCFHSFCYKCIMLWSGAVTRRHSQTVSIKCPLCKTENFSIVHEFDGEFFQRDYVNQDSGKSYLSNFHKFRLQCYTNKAVSANALFDVQRYWKCRKFRQKNVWLQSWLKREIQSLTQEEDVDVIVHHILGATHSFFERQERVGVKARLEQKQEEFRALLCDAARPFILGRSERFVDEVELFLASGLNIEAYDKVYMQFAGISASGLTVEHDEE